MLNKSRLSLSRLLEAAQFFALLIGGIWALLEYTSFRRENSKLSLEQQRFAVEQQEIARKQQVISLDLAKVNLAREEKEAALSGVALSKAKQARYTLEWTTRTKRIRQIGVDVFFDVTSNATIKNTSDTDVTVEYTVMELFLSDPESMLRSHKPVVEIDFPLAIGEDIYNPSLSPELEWKKLGGRAHMFSESTHYSSVNRDILHRAGYDNPLRGSGGTVILKSGESTYAGYTCLLRAKRGSWIGAVISIGFDDGRYLFDKNVQPLAEQKNEK